MLNTVNNNAIFDERWQLAFNLNAAIVAADVGKAVTIDTAGPNRVKLATTGDAIFGRLEVFEDRQTGKVGTINTRGICKMPKTGTVTVGQSVSGSATPGSVIGVTADWARNIVLEVDNTANTVVVLIK